MSNKRYSGSIEELLIQYLKKNKNFFLNNPELLDILNFPNNNKYSKNIVDLNVYKSNKIIKENTKIKKQISDILKAGSNHIQSQKRILKTSLKILNSKSLSTLIDVISNDFGHLLGCDIINCFYTSKKIEHKGLSLIENKVASNFFSDKPQTYLNQNPRGISIFFPKDSKIVKSYILIKIIYNSDRFIVAMGSKNSEKFTKDQKVDLIEYLIQITQIKLTQF